MVNKRGKNYSQSNIEKMLDLIEESNPCGIDEWDQIASTFNSHFGNGENRSGDDLRNKFKALKNVRKPTGDPDIPPNVLRAKNAQKDIESRMCIQTLGGDKSDDDNDSADGGFPREGLVDDNFRQAARSDDNRRDDESHGGGSNDSMGSLNFDDDQVDDSVTYYRQSTIQSENELTPVDHPLRNHAHWEEQVAEMDEIAEEESGITSPISNLVSQSSYPGASEGTRAALVEINRGINAFRSARDSAAAAASRGVGQSSVGPSNVGPSRRSPRRVAPTAVTDLAARRVEEPPVSVRVPASRGVSQNRGQAPAGRTGTSAPAARSGSAVQTSTVTGTVSTRIPLGSGVSLASAGVSAAGRSVVSFGGRGAVLTDRAAPAGRMASRSISGSSRSNPSSQPPLAAPPACPSSVTTSRTGLTEDQLKDMSTRIKRSNTPSFSETVNKRRRLDAAIERNSDFLSRQDNDASGSGGNDSLIHMLMMQYAQRDARSEEYRQQEVIRAERRQDEVERREELERIRQEQRREDQLEREENRRRDDIEREERREKNDTARSQMMFMFMNQKRNDT